MRGVAKADLPRTTCAHCGRTFTWRKKWEREWERVKYCSDRCRGEAKRDRTRCSPDRRVCSRNRRGRAPTMYRPVTVSLLH